MKFKKTMAIGLTLAMSAACLAGCGSNKTTDSQVNLSNGAAVTYNGDKIYPVQCEDTLTFWMPLNTIVAQSVENFGDTPLAKNLLDKTGVKITYMHPTSGQENEQFQLLLASNELPDMVTNGWCTYPGGPQNAINEKYILSLNKVFEKFAPNITKLLSERPELDKAIKTDDGNYFAFPFAMEEGILQVSKGPIIRQDWLDKLGIEKPQTVDQIEEMLVGFREKCGATAPMTVNADNAQWLMASAYNTWTDWYLDDGEIKYGPAQPGFKEMLEKLNDWYKKGLLDADFATNNSAEMRTKMLTGASGLSLGYAGSDMGQWLKAGDTVSGYDLSGIRFPAATAGATPEFSCLSSSVGNSSVAINTNCKNIELAARYLDFGYGEEGHNVYNFGEEGVSYNWVDKDGEKYPQYTDLIMNNPDGLSVSAAMAMYQRACYSGPMVQDVAYIEQYYPTQQQKNAQKEWGVTNMAKHLVPQMYVTQTESDRDSEIMTNIKTYKDEMIVKFISGKEPIENFDAYLEQLDKFGLKESIKFRQDAYKKYTER